MLPAYAGASAYVDDGSSLVGGASVNVANGAGGRKRAKQKARTSSLLPGNTGLLFGWQMRDSNPRRRCQLIYSCHSRVSSSYQKWSGAACIQGFSRMQAALFVSCYPQQTPLPQHFPHKRTCRITREDDVLLSDALFGGCVNFSVVPPSPRVLQRKPDSGCVNLPRLDIT